MFTALTMTTAPRVGSERTVIGTYFCLPFAAVSMSRYAPAGQPVVGTVNDGFHVVLTRRSDCRTTGAG